MAHAERARQRKFHVMMNTPALSSLLPLHLFVHEPLRNLMLDDSNSLKFFEPTDAGITSTRQLKESFTDLMLYCEQEAKPSFEKITTLDLAPLCEFGGDQAAVGVEETLKERKDEVINELQVCMGWYRDLSIPDDAGEVTSQLVEPVLLEPLMETYSDASFASAYMPDWRTGGKFLSAIEELRNMLHDLDLESQGLQEKIASLTDQMQENARLRDEISELVRQAIEEKKIADENEAEAKKNSWKHNRSRRDNRKQILIA